MTDKRLKTIQQIQEILRHLSADTDAETISVKAEIIRARLNQLKDKITVGNQCQQKELKTKDKQYKGLFRKLRESEEKNFKLEEKLKEFKQFHRKKSLYYDKKIGNLHYETEKYEKLLKKKLAAQDRVKECKKVIYQLQQKLKQYEKFLASSKGLSTQRDQEELVEKVFSKLKNFIQVSQMTNKQQVEKMREIIKNQSKKSEKGDNLLSENNENFCNEEDEEDEVDDKMSVIEDQLYDSDEQEGNQIPKIEECIQGSDEKKEIVVQEQQISGMEFLGQEQQNWLDWILSLTLKK